VKSTRLTDWLFLACLFCATFEKAHWEVAGAITLTDLLTILFAVVYVAGRLGMPGRPVPRTEAILLGFGTAFVLVYLFGYFNLDTHQALTQWTKGLVKFFLHFGFLLIGFAYLFRRTARSERFFWQSLTAFLAGISFNAVYGVLQLAVAQLGGNLDDLFLNPLTGGASKINLYGQVNGTSVYRPNALTGDPNHLGIVLCVPLLVLTPIYLRLEPGHHLRRRLAALLALLLLVEIATLSRSGILGLIIGFLVLLLPYRRKLWTRTALAPVAAGGGGDRGGRGRQVRLRQDGVPRPYLHGQRVDLDAPRRLRLHPSDLPPAPAVRTRPEQLLGLLPARHREDQLGAALVLRLALRRHRARRRRRFRRLSLVPVPAARGGREGRPRAGGAA
jgi:hypothetical protein